MSELNHQPFGNIQDPITPRTNKENLSSDQCAPLHLTTRTVTGHDDDHDDSKWIIMIIIRTLSREGPLHTHRSTRTFLLPAYSPFRFQTFQAPSPPDKTIVEALQGVDVLSARKTISEVSDMLELPLVCCHQR